MVSWPKIIIYRLQYSDLGLSPAPDEAIVACECDSGCNEDLEDCVCIGGQGTAYDADGRFDLNFEGVVVECNKVNNI